MSMCGEQAPSRPASFGSRRALLLQGPMGPFFRRLRAELESAGVQTWKVNFNAGDAIFDRGPHCLPFTGSVEEWPSFFEELVRKLEIDTVFLFGDGRVYHRLARDKAEELSLRLFVFEEGYLRPGFVTVERDGVNTRSSLPREARPYLRAYPTHARFKPLPAPQDQPAFWQTAWYSTLYSLALTFANRGYAHYEHHRPMHAVREAVAWVRAGIRRLAYERLEAEVLPRLTTAWSKRFFLVPLQVYCDHQLRHASLDSMPKLIRTVAEDFAHNAPPDAALVFKHHPLDRGYTNFRREIRSAGAQHGILERVFYIHDQHLPTLLRHAAGCVTLNSTVGLQALKYGTPVKVLGPAVYNMEGLTDPQPLARFWSAPTPPDEEVLRAFRAWLIYHNQARGNFYRRYPAVETHTAMDWPPAVRELEEPQAQEIGTAASKR